MIDQSSTREKPVECRKRMKQCDDQNVECIVPLYCFTLTQRRIRRLVSWRLCI